MCNAPSDAPPSLRERYELRDLETCRRVWEHDEDPRAVWAALAKCDLPDWLVNASRTLLLDGADRGIAKRTGLNNNLNDDLDDPRQALTPAAWHTLEDHLSKAHSDRAALDNAMLAIACAVRDAKAAIEESEQLQIANADTVAHFAAIHDHAVALRALLEQRGARIGLSSRFWTRVVPVLNALITSARAHVEDAQPRKPGPTSWRDRLIATVFYSAYPLGTAKKTEGGHFETTVGMVLRVLDPLSDESVLHQTILRALARGPNPYRIL